MEGGEHETLKVTVHVGKETQEFQITEHDLSQSPVLTSYIIRRLGRPPCVWDPDLRKVDCGDFEAVKQFLKGGEFEPRYVHQKDNDGVIQAGAGSLEGITTLKDDCTQITRLGKLYLLARKFDLSNMQDLIRQKLVAGFPRGYRAKTVLLLIGQIFKTIPGNVNDAVALPGEIVRVSLEDQHTDELKVWLVKWLANEMRAITSVGTATQYWETLDAIPGLSLAVFREKAKLVEQYRGEYIKIEDDSHGGLGCG